MGEAAISLQLPRKGVTAGAVLRHAINTFQRLHSRLSPMSYKFGFTHCPCFRWCNSVYGYAVGREKYEKMIILYVAADCQGPAFLEASLINLYEGFLFQNSFQSTFFYSFTNAPRCVLLVL